MKVRDKNLKEWVDVADKQCLKRKCYWPRPDPGSFTQGKGYSTRRWGNRGWLCGEREVRGCPHIGVCVGCRRVFLELETKCRSCGAAIGPAVEERREG